MNTPLKERTALTHRLLLGPNQELYGIDEQGLVFVKEVAPPVCRTPMIPEPWITNPLKRLYLRLRGRDQAPRRHVDVAESKWRAIGTARRLLLLTVLIIQTVIATSYMSKIMPYQGWGMFDPSLIWADGFVLTLQKAGPYILQAGILVLFAILFCWVSAGFWTAVMGFWELLVCRDRYQISGKNLSTGPVESAARTAIVMPICNEDTTRVFAGLRATFESLRERSEFHLFDMYILSDTNDPDIAVAEQNAWRQLCEETASFGRIFYRRRRRRVKRKSGNIDDFCRRWGGNYRYMIVFDADSVMTGEGLEGMVRLMESNPDAGIIQTSPKAFGMDTFYARMQQFATRMYGPLFTAGLHYWQLGESHYWGHNAIIRLKPFIEHCALAPLPGTGSFAGAILSHDFVEAALMRRAGWGVWIAYDLPGSYEELPPNLIDELKRDRRWCQGNLMNFRLFLAKGMHPVHRAVFLTGVMSYLSAPLWFFFLLLSTTLLAVHTLMEPQYFLSARQLYPVWPQWNPDHAIALFAATMTMLFLPKVLSVILVLIKGCKPYGGALKVIASTLVEIVFSALLAPVRMIYHTKFVLAAFLGWEFHWKSPQRDDDATPWSEAFRHHGSQTLLGVCWAALIVWLNPSFLWWMSPIIVAMITSTAVSVFTSRSNLGLKLKANRYFCIPEEDDVPTALKATITYTKQNRETPPFDGFAQALTNTSQNYFTAAMAQARHLPTPLITLNRQRNVSEALAQGRKGTSTSLRLAILSDPVQLQMLIGELRSRPDSDWHRAATGATVVE